MCSSRRHPESLSSAGRIDRACVPDVRRAVGGAITRSGAAGHLEMPDGAWTAPGSAHVERPMRSPAQAGRRPFARGQAYTDPGGTAFCAEHLRSERRGNHERDVEDSTGQGQGCRRIRPGPARRIPNRGDVRSPVRGPDRRARTTGRRCAACAHPAHRARSRGLRLTRHQGDHRRPTRRPPGDHRLRPTRLAGGGGCGRSRRAAARGVGESRILVRGPKARGRSGPAA